MILHHVTILTGHAATHRLDTLDPTAVSACAALLPTGGPIPGFPAFRVSIESASIIISRGRDKLVWCVIGSPANQKSWDAIVDAQKHISGSTASPKMPNGHWLAVVILPGISTVAQSDLGWIGDFERCMAAAILNRK